MAAPKDLVNIVVTPYLRGTEIARIELELFYSNITQKNFKDWPITGKSTRNKFDYEALTKKILVELNVFDEEQQQAIIHDPSIKNLYDLLIHLYRDGHHHLGRLITVIDEAKPRNRTPRWVAPAIFTSLFAIFAALFEHFNHTRFMQILTMLKDFGLKAFDWIRQVAAVARNAAFIGILFNGLQFLYQSKNIISDHKLTNAQKSYELLFALAKPILIITAYLVSYAMGGAMSLLSTSLFVSASALAILKSSLTLITAYRNANHDEKNPDLMTTTERAQYLRTNYDYWAQRSGLIIDVLSAILTTAVIAVWNFMPTTIALVAGCSAALVLIEAVSTYISTRNKNHYDDALQYEIRHIEGINEDKTLEHTAATNQALAQLIAMGFNTSPEPITASVEHDAEQHITTTTFKIPAGIHPGSQISLKILPNEDQPSKPHVELLTKPLTQTPIAKVLPFHKGKPAAAKTLDKTEVEITEQHQQVI